ncbi:MAG: ATP-binding protein [Firmicutes bacterium]|nr:ATP-binding protein [Bacillota bacterium]
MKRRLFISFFIPVFLLVVAFMGIVGLLSFRTYNQQLENDLVSIVSLISYDTQQGIKNEDIINKYDVIGKLSFIDKEGKLITSFDSAIEDDKNILAREEVKEALKANIGSSLRYEENTKEFTFYKAFISAGEIIIIAIPLISQSALIIASIGYIFLAVLLTIGISGVFSYFFYKRNIEPMMILEKYIRRTYKHKAIAQVGIQSLPIELKRIADIFKETTKSLQEYAEKEEEQKLYLYSTIDTMVDGFIAIDENEDIKLINKSAISIFALNKENVIGSNLLVQTQNFELSNAVKEIDNTVTISDLVIDNKTYKLTIYTLEKNMGKLIILYDITKLNQLENMRKEFVSNVSHELKTPLTAIIGFIETLKDGAIDEPDTARKFLGIIELESQRLEMLIGDLLELSSIESNKIDRLNEDIDIKDIAGGAIEAFKTIADKNNVALVNNVTGNYVIKGNLELFKAMLYNLISNGIKYNVKDGSVSINCKYLGEGIVMEIIDTGIGISKDNLFRIFERFYKVDKSRSYDPESTGLGLAIVKHILELFDGDISVDSILGEGTTFRIYLPKKEV